eukprot:5626666-Prymnesium_polylepis.1
MGASRPAPRFRRSVLSALQRLRRLRPHRLRARQPRRLLRRRIPLPLPHPAAAAAPPPPLPHDAPYYFKNARHSFLGRIER